MKKWKVSRQGRKTTKKRNEEGSAMIIVLLCEWRELTQDFTVMAQWVGPRLRLRAEMRWKMRLALSIQVTVCMSQIWIQLFFFFFFCNFKLFKINKKINKERVCVYNLIAVDKNIDGSTWTYIAPCFVGIYVYKYVFDSIPSSFCVELRRFKKF